MERERDLLFGGSGLPELAHDLAGRPVLVVVRGYSYREDLAALRAYIRDIRPVLVGVDGGADALLDDGYVPDLILGDMDSVSDRALSLASKRSRRRPPTELVLHAYTDGRAPGGARLDRLGVPYTTVRSAGTSEDVAFLLAHEKGAELIVAVGHARQPPRVPGQGTERDEQHVPRPPARRRDPRRREGRVADLRELAVARPRHVPAGRFGAARRCSSS